MLGIGLALHLLKGRRGILMATGVQENGSKELHVPEEAHTSIRVSAQKRELNCTVHKEHRMVL